MIAGLLTIFGVIAITISMIAILAMMHEEENE